MPEVEEFDEKTKAMLTRKGYEIKEALNSGAFGQVYKAVRTANQELVAVKVMNLEKVSEKMKQKFLPREMAVITECCHPNIVQVYDIFRSNRRIFIFMEFAGRGDITGWLKNHGAISEGRAYLWFSQVTEGMNYLHSEQHVAHRDVKIDNILLNDQFVAKVTDFGFAKESYDQQKKKVVLSETYCGTEPYYSPQLIRREMYDPFMADCWAMGVVLFAMLNNKFPFRFGKKHGPKGMLKEQMDPTHLTTRYVREFSKHAKTLMERFLDPDVGTRLCIKDALKSKWFEEKGNCLCK